MTSDLHGSDHDDGAAAFRAEFAGKEFMEDFPYPSATALPRRAGLPLLLPNSRAASFITDENLNTDGGTMGAIMTGSIDPAILSGAGRARAEK